MVILDGSYSAEVCFAKQKLNALAHTIQSHIYSIHVDTHVVYRHRDGVPRYSKRRLCVGHVLFLVILQWTRLLISIPQQNACFSACKSGLNMTNWQQTDRRTGTDSHRQTLRVAYDKLATDRQAGRHRQSQTDTDRKAQTDRHRQ